MKPHKLLVVSLFLIFSMDAFSAIYSNDASELVKMMWQLVDYKDYDRIFSEGNKIIANSKDSSDIAEIHAVFGYIYYKQERYDFAEKELKKALLYNPDSKSAQTEISLVYSETNRMEEGIKILKKLVENYPDDIQLLWILGDFYRGDEQLDKAIDCYEKILSSYGNMLKNNPNLKLIFINMISIYDRKNDSANAYKYMKELLEYFPNDYEALLLSAKLLINFGDDREAIEKLNIIMDNFDPEEEDYCVMGVAYYKLKEYDKARYYFGEALKLDKNYDEALEYINDLNKIQ